MTDDVKADVLIPAFNAQDTVADAVESILNQTFSNIRVIVVDDGSTDDTPRILANLKKRDPRVEIISTPNAGIVDALNLGLSHCTAEYVARFDADDISYPDRIQIQFDYLEAHSECLAVAGRVDHIDEAGNRLYGLPQPGSPDAADMDGVPALEPYLIHPFLMARRAALIAAGGYRYVCNSEDSDLYWRLAEIGRLHNLDVPLGRYRVHSGSISGSSVVGSRVMAIFSQLGAISAQRRRAGSKDLSFPKGASLAFREAKTLDGMWSLASRQLSSEEASYLRISASMKLLQLAGYRPIQLEVSDCKFIRQSLDAYPRLTKENERQNAWQVTTTAARLLRAGRYREAMALLPISAYPMTLARLAKNVAQEIVAKRGPSTLVRAIPEAGISPPPSR
jgi:glycosyltransferase involved in cell wall biosynthesis